MAANCGGGARQPRFKEASPGAGMWSATPALTSSSCSASDRRIHALHVIAGLQLLHAHRVGLAAAGLLHLRSGSCLTPLVGGGRSVAVEPAAGVGAPAAEERTRRPLLGARRRTPHMQERVLVIVALTHLAESQIPAWPDTLQFGLAVREQDHPWHSKCAGDLFEKLGFARRR